MSGAKEKSKPTPLETDPGEQHDDNIDDLGRRPDGTEQDQPVDGDHSDKTKDPRKPR
ncbi:hypothetical protein O9Z70_06560 [Devosia sp. YIM 151766]|uniref:hypothetical protein n=1 Tax=Devosia sp. YIM 151766 TaxID=3017325 RepID=UPI00255C8CFC|nr:hypothetical protein [Devosia sp. YIM 151766]WIY54178.1 hypothetical protein O9Z70_06560 [Devosia sp. YIM 151766]